MVKERQCGQRLLRRENKRGDFCQYLAYRLGCWNPPPSHSETFNLQGNMKMC